MTLEKQIELLKEWLKGAEMSLPIMSSADIERFLHWLEDYKRLKDEMIPAYDEQLTEAQCKVIQQMREMKRLKDDYIDLDNRLRTANTEIDRLRSESSWISCDKAPEPDPFKNYVIKLESGRVCIGSYFTDVGYVDYWHDENDICCAECYIPRPIPEPPKGE